MIVVDEEGQGMRRAIRSRVWVVAGAAAAFALAVLAGSSAVQAATFGSAEVRGVVKDMDGKPLEGVEVSFTAAGKAAAPLKVKTHKDGTFVFPFLPWEKDKYDAEFTMPGYRVRKIKIMSRQKRSVADRGEGMVIQENEGVIGLDQNIPLVDARPGGIVHIEVGMATEDYFRQMAEAQAASQAAQSGTAGQEEGVKALDPLDQARYLAATGKTEEATQVLQKAIEAGPSAALWLEMAKIRMKGEDSSGAKAALARATTLDTDQVEIQKNVHLMLGKLYNDEGRTPEAITEFEEALKIVPDDMDALRNLGILYPQVDRRKDAIAMYEKLAAQPDADVEVLARLAGLHNDNGDYGQAEALYRRILEMNPGQADATWLKVGLSIMNQPNVGEAERKRAAEAFKKAIDANPSNARAHIELAYVLIGLGDAAEAKSHLKKFIELQPDSPEAKDARDLLKELG